MSQRRTLAGELVFSGTGLHSGQKTTVRLSPTEKPGICICVEGHRYPVEQAEIVETHRMTALRLSGALCVKTVEHLLAALFALGVADVEIYPSGGEIPVMDGSALPFAQAIEACGTRENGPARAGEDFLFSPVALSLGGQSIAAVPSEEFRVSYTICYPGTEIGSQYLSMAITPQSFMRHLAAARTFALEREVEVLREQGLALGGSLDNAVIVGESGVLNASGYRFPDECVAHKIVDFLGDIALLGRRVRAHYIVACGGHSLHGALVGRMRALMRVI